MQDAYENIPMNKVIKYNNKLARLFIDLPSPL